MSYFGTRALGIRLHDESAEHLREAALRVSDGIENYLNTHQRAIGMLTMLLEPSEGDAISIPAASKALELTQRSYPGFLTMLITDAEGDIIVANRRAEKSFPPATREQRSVADREYFRQPRKTRQPYVSGVFQERGLGNEPIVAISAPIVDSGGRFMGVIEGSIDITRLPISADPTDKSRPIVVAQDAAGRVVYSSRSDLHRPFDQWKPYPIQSPNTNAPILLADPALKYASGEPIPLFSSRFPIGVAGWQVVASLPVDEINEEASLFFQNAAAVLLVVILLAWIAARLLARNIARPIVALADAMHDFELDTPGELQSIAPHPAAEIAKIQGEFVRLGNRLRESYRQLRHALAERDQINSQLQSMLLDLDKKVDERTAQLADSENRYRQVVEQSPDIIFRTDALGRITFHNSAFAVLLGGDREADRTGDSYLDLIDEGCRRQVRSLAQQQIRDRTPAIYLEYAITAANGETRWLGQSTQLLLDNSRFPLGFQAIARDVTAKKKAELALREAEDRYALAVRGSNNGIWDWDLRSGSVYYSARWLQMFGITEPDSVGRIEDWLQRIHPEDAASVRYGIEAYVQKGQDLFESEHRVRHADGTWRWILVCGAAVRDADGRALRIAGSKTDVTAGKLADPLTGLPNRLSLLEVLEIWNDRLREDPAKQFAVLFLDLDRFKLINDSLGHVKGDHLLLGVSHRLTAALQSISAADGLVARLGGDEFVVLIDTSNDAGLAVALAEAITRIMEPAFHLDGSLVFVTTSIGIAFSNSFAASTESLLRDADTAMYHAKSLGRGRFASFDNSMHARAVARLGLETDLRRAIDDGEFVLHYQPQVDLRSGVLSGFEALVRWQHPVRGLIPPLAFIPVAEENGLILPIGRWVLRESCRQLAAWDSEHASCRQLSISVNLSARQFTDPTLAGEVARILSETGLNPQRLHLEVTESMLAEDPAVALEILKELSTMGVALEVDDFGTGYSCLGQLNSLPFDTLKIDRSFVRALDIEVDGHKVLDSIATLAASLGINVIAEGIETAEHWAYLSTLGCQFGQGFYFARPLAAADALELAELRHRRPWPVPTADHSSLSKLLEFTQRGPSLVRDPHV